MLDKQSRGRVKNHSKEILLLFSVPAGVIALVMALVFVPRLFANPSYDFIYCEGYSCDSNYSIGQDGKLVATDSQNRFNQTSLHYYDAKRGATRPIQIDEAVRYQLDPTSKSPDGYTLKRSSGSSGFLFWSDYSRDWMLSKGMINQPITLNTNSDSNFIGWVLQ